MPDQRDAVHRLALYTVLENDLRGWQWKAAEFFERHHYLLCRLACFLVQGFSGDRTAPKLRRGDKIRIGYRVVPPPLTIGIFRATEVLVRTGKIEISGTGEIADMWLIPIGGVGVGV
ncbi:hypothetical protein GCM10008096_15230 [Zhihengliuella salsuginis]|uniref:Uncharacterized protein n=1 Tax=Zhihengliuella salsuginis TaxID=578222 RepID=A0ABQ3GIR5_9MICC|nr:hypothetical protein GCM10008096_15230 [Zhihengliuella salsuginis]